MAAWIAVDWGTTHLRAWAMGADDAVLAEAQSADGMGNLDRDGFEPALLALIEPWLSNSPTPVIACGMVGARQGWIEAPYREVPCAIGPGGLTVAPVKDPRIDVRITPGICQQDPPDVMRGEETQIAGFLREAPGFEGMLCLPGTHTKWVRIAKGRVESFRTYMTGEIFALLAERSVLRHSVADGWSDAAFDAAVADALRAPASVAAHLFGIRAQSLLQDLAGREARARLSGLLIGVEIADARLLCAGDNTVIIGDGTLAGHYGRALTVAEMSPEIVLAEGLTLGGLTAIREQMEQIG